MFKEALNIPCHTVPTNSKNHKPSLNANTFSTCHQEFPSKTAELTSKEPLLPLCQMSLGMTLCASSLERPSFHRCLGRAIQLKIQWGLSLASVMPVSNRQDLTPPRVLTQTPIKRHHNHCFNPTWSSLKSPDHPFQCSKGCKHEGKQGLGAGPDELSGKSSEASCRRSRVSECRMPQRRASDSPSSAAPLNFNTWIPFAMCSLPPTAKSPPRQYFVSHLPTTLS